MSKKANPTAIGIFIVAAALLCLATLVIFDSSRFFSKKEKIIMYFNESVNGLDIGAPLKFKGVRIGQVTRIYLDFNQKSEHASIPVIAEIDVHHFQKNLGAKMDITSRSVIKQMIEEDGLRARLQQQSFVTGLLYVELNYHDNVAQPVYVQDGDIQSGEDPLYAEIPTIPGNMAQMLQNISLTLDKVAKMDLVGISNNANSILAQIDKGVGQIDFATINKELTGTLSNMRDLTGNDNLREAFQKLGPMVESAGKTLNSLSTTLDTLSSLSVRVDDLLADDSPMIFQVNHALEELSRTLTSLRVLSDYLERNPSSLFMGKQPAK